VLFRGNSLEHEFVYRGQKAVELAHASHWQTQIYIQEHREPILALLRVRISHSLQRLALVTRDSPPLPSQWTPPPVVAVQTTGEDVEIAQVVTPPPRRTGRWRRPCRRSRRGRCPRRLVRCPLIALFGFLALAWLRTLRLVQKRLSLNGLGPVTTSEEIQL